MSTVTVTEDMLIGDILQKLPESAEIMENYGLHCTSCSVNAFEPLKAGAMSHGLPENVVDEMIAEIQKLGTATKRMAPDDGIYMTEKAARKVQEFAAHEEKAGWGLKITAEDNGGQEPVYMMDFQESATDDDQSFEFHGVCIFLNPDSLKNLLGAEIDFVETQYGSGFKIDNPNFQPKNGCACGKGGCGCGGQGGGCGSGCGGH